MSCQSISQFRVSSLVIAVAAIAMLVFSSGCQLNRPNTTAGGLLGGTTGGILGGAIGSRQGKTEEGALIGAVAGSITGATLGNQTDRRNDQIQQQEIAYAQSAQQAAQAAQQSAVTFGQVIEMTRSGLSDELIINQINAAGIAQRPVTDDLIQLKQNGVSDNVIREMQTLGSRVNVVSNQPPRLYPAVPTVGVPVVHQPFCATPVIRRPPILVPQVYPGRVGRRGGRRGGFSINF